MATSSRGMRFFWLFGIVLLLGTALGASWMLNQPASGTPPTAPPEVQIRGVVGLGHVDVENGITSLHPLQRGEVKTVHVKEGDKVKKDDKLISIDNGMQKIKLAQAEAALDSAQSALKDAETLLIKKWKHEIEEQKQRIVGARSELAIVANELKVAETNFKDSPPLITAEVLEMAKEKVKAKDAAVKGHEEALKKIEDNDPKGTIDRARSDMELKQAMRDEAKLAVSQCDLLAPADGLILRLFATPGEVLTSQPRQYAVQFCPDAPRIIRAEILQEFANKIQKGQVALIEDDTRSGIQWKGKVEHVAPWFSERRLILLEPFQYNNQRTLECIVTLDLGGPPLRINQRVRVIILQGGI